MQFTLVALLLSTSSVFAVTCNTKSASETTIKGSKSSATVLGCLTVEYCASKAGAKAVACSSETNTYTILSALPSAMTCDQSEAASALADKKTGSRTTCCKTDKCNVIEEDAVANAPVAHDEKATSETATETATTTTTTQVPVAQQPRPIVVSGTTTVVGSTVSPTPSNSAGSLLPGIVAIGVIASALLA